MAKANPKEALHTLAHDLRNVINNVNLNLTAAKKIAARLQSAEAGDLREILGDMEEELKRLKQMVEKAAKDLA